MNSFLILLLVFVCAASNEDCEPYGTRAFLGRVYIDNASDELLNLKFNTNSSCPGSFVMVKQGLLSQTYPCSVEEIIAINKTTFRTYVHSCSLTNLKFGLDIEYSVFGVDTESQRSYQYMQRSFNVTMVDPTADRKNQFLALADWSPILTQTYIPIIDSLVKLSQTNRTDIHGVMIQGDIGYDLDSQECQNYMQFLNMLEKISVVWPIILSTGNHEYNTANNWNLYSKSFEIYNMSSDRKMQSYRFKWMTFTTIDPYRQVYGRSSQTETNLYVDQLKSELADNQKMNKPFAVTASHYPLICSSGSKNCTQNNVTLGQLFSTMNDYRVDMYIGAHTHTYERQFPWWKGSIAAVEGPYHNIDGLVTVVEGVAGNDKDIIEEVYPLKQFTAKATFNETGFGMLVVHNNTHMEYLHFSTQGGTHVEDSVLMTKYRTESTS